MATTYGAEAAQLTALHDERKLRSAKRAIEIRMTGIPLRDYTASVLDQGEN